MPIILDKMDDDSTVQITKTYSPKFFDQKFTGSGKHIGLLNANRDPVHIPNSLMDNQECYQQRKTNYINGLTEVTIAPMDILTKEALPYMQHVNTPDTTNLCEIGSVQQRSNANTAKLYMDMKVWSLHLEEVFDKANGNSKTLTPAYLINLYTIVDPNDPKCKHYYDLSDYVWSQKNNNENNLIRIHTCNPKKAITDALGKIGQRTLSMTVDQQAIEDYINNYSLYDHVCDRAREWETDADKILDEYFEQVATNYNGNHSAMNEVTRVIRKLEDYAVPLDLYRNIYNSLTKHFKADDVVILCKQNLNLLLSDTLNNLETNKALLTRITPPTQPMNLSQYSPEQIKAITATEPLVLVQSGAGTGKSTVILKRIEYMVHAGVKPEDITVLSFTNAAANNISEKCPSVHSMTIARMIHTIYSANFKDHELSSLETIINSIDIYFNNDQIARKLKNKLWAITKNESNAFVSLNNFIESNYDEVIRILDTIKQTSLELEIVICYKKIDSFIEPPEVQSKYLIIDEVQDNSVFEFVYTIKYVDKHKESLYIVGDCSQTLYEFRASNPKALNVLESSGVFATYQLQVNYRSNQEILSFANVVLRNIEANQYARIQLQANSLAKITSQSFKDKVNFKYKQVAKLSEFTDNMDAIFAVEVKPYIDQCMAKGEKVAFLAFTRREVNKIRAILEHMYPGKSVVSLVSDKGYNSTIFSEFIKRYWHEIKFAPSTSIVTIISQEIINHLGNLVYDKNVMLKSTQRLLANWRDDQQVIIDNWQRMHLSGQMSLDDFLNNVRNSMLQYEIRNNAIRQALLSARNEEKRKADIVANADLILSTIHSAKGLEFPNVVVVYHNENIMSEDKKRMYYVAFTRAMKSELVLAYGTVVHPAIETDYNEIINVLDGKSTATAPAEKELDSNNAANSDIAKAQAFIKKKGFGNKTIAELQTQSDENNADEPLTNEMVAADTE